MTWRTSILWRNSRILVFGVYPPKVFVYKSCAGPRNASVFLSYFPTNFYADELAGEGRSEQRGGLRAWTSAGLASFGSAYTARWFYLLFLSRYHEEGGYIFMLTKVAGSGKWMTHAAGHIERPTSALFRKEFSYTRVPGCMMNSRNSLIVGV